ncbi:glucose 1-dehydrogenase [Streptomyces tauricus]|uniref:glucose 1-dehydrogenase n=1 Tax=Streptomyces tauricus TaxID=68274 RepID=UPI0033A0B80C
MGQLDGKIALVTGGTTGIGLGTARRFAREGATVYITGRRKSELDAAVESIGADVIGVQSDVSQPADLDALFATVKERSGRLDVLFANAGVGGLVELADVTEDEYDRTFDINVKGMFFTMQKALPLLPDGASVILTSSTNASQGIPAMSVYSATKAAARNFARSWAAELAGRRIRVNSISPGPIETPGLLDLAGDEADARRVLTENFSHSIPLGRMGHVDDVASAAVFLASDQSSFTTGAELFVDGGLAQI